MLVPCIWLISDCFDQSRLILPIRCVLLEDSLPPTGRFLLSFVKPIKTNLSQLPSLQWKPRSVWPSGILISFFTSCEAVMVSWCHDISYVSCGTLWNPKAPQCAFATSAFPCQRRPLPAALQCTTMPGNDYNDCNACNVYSTYITLYSEYSIMWRYLEKP